MDIRFLSRLRNPIEWKWWLKAGFATLAAALPAFFSFSFWSVAFALALYLFSFFFRRAAREETLPVAFSLFVAFLSLGSFVLVRETNLFDYLGGVQSVVFLIVFLFFLLVFAAGAEPLKRSPIPEAAVYTVLLMLWVILGGMFIDRVGPLWFFGFGLGVYLLSLEMIARAGGKRSGRIHAYAVFSAFLASELLYTLRFLPFHLIAQAILVSVALIVFFDVLRVEMQGKIVRRFVIEKLSVFMFFLLLLGLFSKWTP